MSGHRKRHSDQRRNGGCGRGSSSRKKRKTEKKNIKQLYLSNK